MTAPDRIDHAAEAQRLLDRPAQFDNPDLAELSADLSAQVHATLALVEQQRIANLIALATSDHWVSKYFVPVINGLLGEDSLRPDIAAALGVSDE